MTVAELINLRLAELNKGRTELRAELERVGVKVTRQAIHAWCSGVSCPDAHHVVALWEVLVIPPEAREAWMHGMALARRRETAA